VAWVQLPIVPDDLCQDDYSEHAFRLISQTRKKQCPLYAYYVIASDVTTSLWDRMDNNTNLFHKAIHPILINLHSDVKAHCGQSRLYALCHTIRSCSDVPSGP